mgnify:CR=1 FL=1
MKTFSPHQIVCKKILADLQDEYLLALQAECMEYGHYEDIGNGYSEFIYEDWVLENLEQVDEMISFLGFDTFEEWFIEYAETESVTNMSLTWTKDLAETFYKIIQELEGN